MIGRRPSPPATLSPPVAGAVAAVMVAARPAAALELAPQRGTGPVQADPRVVRGDPERRRRLGNGHAAEVDPLDDRRILGLERWKKIEHTAAGDVLDHRVLLSGELLSGQHCERSLLAPASAIVIDERVAKELVEPRDGALLVADRRAFLERSQVGSLQHLERDLAVGQAPLEELQEAIAVLKKSRREFGTSQGVVDIGGLHVSSVTQASALRRGRHKPIPCAVLFATAIAGCAEPVAAPPPTRPPLAEPQSAVDLNPAPGSVEVHLEAVAAEVDYRGGGARTAVAAYRDAGRPTSTATVPGPLIVADVGDTIVVRFSNRLADRTTTIHWHGLRLPADMDGNPAVSGAVYPDRSFTYTFTARDAGLFWYHPHVDTDEQMELGLYGPLLVRAPGEPVVDAERVLVLDDVDLDEDGQVRLTADADDVALGRHGDVILVNGVERPSLEVAAGTTERWRIVNAANGRYFALELAGHEFVVVGGDGGPLPSVQTTDVLLIAPGERHDVLLTIAADPGTRAWLRSAAVDRGHAELPGFDVMELRVGSPTMEPVIVDPVRFTAAIEALPISAQTPERTFRLGEDLDHPNGPRFSINDELWPFNTPIVAALGDLEVWSIENEGDGDHPFHLHGVFFQVLDRDGIAEPQLAWKDTVRVGPHETLRLAVRHETLGMWMYHCQIPEHAEGGMTGDLMVTE